jgi:hypothetical protein
MFRTKIRQFSGETNTNMYNNLILKWKKRLCYKHKYNTLLMEVVCYSVKLYCTCVWKREASYISLLILFAYFLLVLPEDGPGIDWNTAISR